MFGSIDKLLRKPTRPNPQAESVPAKVVLPPLRSPEKGSAEYWRMLWLDECAKSRKLERRLAGFKAIQDALQRRTIERNKYHRLLRRFVLDAKEALEKHSLET